MKQMQFVLDVMELGTVNRLKCFNGDKMKREDSIKSPLFSYLFKIFDFIS